MRARPSSPQPAPVRTGLDVALDDPPAVLTEARAFGVVANQASLTSSYESIATAMLRRFPGRLRALFGPQHGLWNTEQDNMIETAHATFRGLPVWSLYSKTRRPTDAMLRDLDLLVVDLQDVGTRVYTYIWTLVLCMQAAAERGLPVLVLDRPNPIGGRIAEGPLLDLRFRSFVGLAPIPMRHGLTLGELARHCNDALAIGCELHVQPMTGWSRDMLWPATGLAWLPPSPNLPRYEGVVSYPGQVLLEGTMVSEGRGTTTPFELFGAPWLDPDQLLARLDAHGGIAGATLRPTAFEPTFQKYAGETCRGLFVHVTDANKFRSYRMTISLLRAMRELWPTAFAWRPPPYEYESVLPPIDILAGDDRVRRFVDDGDGDLEQLAAAPTDWWQRASAALLYHE